MKIAYKGLNLPEGKRKFNDHIFMDLAKKFQPLKLSPYYFEFLPEDYLSANAIVITKEKLLDLLIFDIEKIDGRLSRSEDSVERRILEKCMAHLENLRPMSSLLLDPGEHIIVNALGTLSYKPTVVFEDASVDADVVCQAVLKEAGMMFFYTVGKQEVHAWLVNKNATAVACADKIHSELARGFVKAEIVNFDDMMATHSIPDARSRGLTKLVDRDYVISENTILEIRSSL